MPFRGLAGQQSMRTDFAPDALEQAMYDRQPERDGSLICHSDRLCRQRCQAFFAQALHQPFALTCLPANKAQLPCASAGFDCQSAQPLQS